MQIRCTTAQQASSMLIKCAAVQRAGSPSAQRTVEEECTMHTSRKVAQVCNAHVEEEVKCAMVQGDQVHNGATSREVAQVGNAHVEEVLQSS